MHKKDAGAICTDIHGDVDEFEAMSDLRGDRFFRLVDTSIDSTEHCIHTLIDTTPQSEMKDPRPGTAIQSSTTVTHFTPVENYSTTQSTMTAVETQPSTRRQQCTEFTGKHEPVCSAPSMTVPYDNLPYNDIPYNNSPYDDSPYDILPYDDTPYDIIPYDDTPYDIIPYDDTPYHSTTVLYREDPLARSAIALVPAATNCMQQSQELLYQSVMKFFPHFSHPPYFWSIKTSSFWLSNMCFAHSKMLSPVGPSRPMADHVGNYSQKMRVELQHVK